MDFEEKQANQMPESEKNENNSSFEEVKKEDKKRYSNLLQWGFNILFLAAIVALFIIHFTGAKKTSLQLPPVPEGTPASGEIVYVNIDSINAHYQLVEILISDIEAEKRRQEVVFTNRQKTLENKYAQFQQNYQANILTPVQIQNAQEQLMRESEALQMEYEQVLANLQNRQLAALQQISDSLTQATKKVNAWRNASFVLTYQYGGQILVPDPAKDITPFVLDELNKSFSKK